MFFDKQLHLKTRLELHQLEGRYNIQERGALVSAIMGRKALIVSVFPVTHSGIVRHFDERYFESHLKSLFPPRRIASPFGSLKLTVFQADCSSQKVGYKIEHCITHYLPDIHMEFFPILSILKPIYCLKLAVEVSALWAERSCFVFILKGFDFRRFVGGREETDRKVSYKLEINNVIKSAHTVSAGAICLVVPAHISYRFCSRNQFPQKT